MAIWLTVDVPINTHGPRFLLMYPFKNGDVPWFVVKLWQKGHKISPSTSLLPVKQLCRKSLSSSVLLEAPRASRKMPKALLDMAEIQLMGNARRVFTCEFNDSLSLYIYIYIYYICHMYVNTLTYTYMYILILYVYIYMQYTEYLRHVMYV